MTTKKSNLLKAFILLVCLTLCLCFAACSQRETEEEGTDIVDPTQTDDSKASEKVTRDQAFAAIDKSMKYLDQKVYNDPEWLCIDTVVNFDFHTYQKSGSVYTKAYNALVEYSLTVRANISLKDNSKSVVFIEFDNTRQGATYLGLYYFDSTLYLTLANGKYKYYTEQINFTRIGQMLVELLKMNTDDETDIPEMVGNFLQKDKGDLLNGLGSMIWMMLMENNAYITYSSGEGGFFTYTGLVDGREKTLTVPKYQYVTQYLAIDTLMGFIKQGKIQLGSFLDLDFSSWETFGLPNLDNILRDTIGFGLYDIIHKDWPSMRFALYSVGEMKSVTLTDGSDSYDYVFNGVGLSILTDTGEYDVALEATPFILEPSSEKRVSISFEGYGLGEGGKGSTYIEGSLTNIEANLQLAVNNTSNGEDVITLKGLLGNVISLGDLGGLPIVFGPKASYVFDLGIAASLDLFDNSNNFAKAQLRYNGNEVFAVYLAPDLNNTVIDGGRAVKILDTVYFDFHNLTSGGKTFIPNTKISQIDLTSSLEKMVGEQIMGFIDPYRGDTTASRNRASNAFSYVLEEPTGLNVMEIIGLLISEKENWDGTGSRYKYLNLPKKGQSSKFSINLDNYALNKVASMFVGGMTITEEDDMSVTYSDGIGLKGVSLSIDFKNPLSSIRLKADITENTSLTVGIGSDGEEEGTYNKGIGYFVKPQMNMAAVGVDDQGRPTDDAAALRGGYLELSKSLSYAATVTGRLSVGSEENTSLNLDGVVEGLLKNILAEMGINLPTILASVDVETGSSLNISYKIQVAASLIDLGSVEAVVDLYFLDEKGDKQYNGSPFLEIYLNGGDDTLYIDTQVNVENDLTKQLNDNLPLTKIIEGRIPKLSLPNTGIAAMLSGKGVDISSIFSLLGVIGYEKKDDGTPANGYAIRFDNGVLNAAEDGTVDIEPQETDILGLAGGILSGINIDEGALGILINRNVLSTVVAMASLDLSGLPEVNGSLYLQLGTEEDRNEAGEKLYKLADGTIYTVITDEEGQMTGHTESGEIIDGSTLTLNPKLKDTEFVRAHVGIVDSIEGEKELFYIDLVLIDTVNISRTDTVDHEGTFTSSEYTPLTEFTKELEVSLDVELEIAISATTEQAEWDNLYALLSGLLGDSEAAGGLIDSFGPFLQSAALRLYNDYFVSVSGDVTGLALGLAVRGTANIADIFESELSVVLFDKSSLQARGYTASDGHTYETVIGIYLKKNKAYIDLSYLGISLLSIADVRNTFRSINAAGFEAKWDETFVVDSDGEAQYVMTDKMVFLDEEYRQEMLTYFMQNQYGTYNASEVNGRWQSYFMTNFPKTTYKYFVWNEKLLQGDKEAADYYTNYYGNLGTDYGIYIYVADDIAKFFYTEADENTLRLKPGYDGYELRDNGTIVVYKGNGTEEIPATIRENKTVRFNIAELQREMETSEYGETTFDEALFEVLLKANAKSNFDDFVAKYVGYWNVTRENSPRARAYLDEAYQENVEKMTDYYRAFYVNSATFTTDTARLDTLVLAELRKTPEYSTLNATQLRSLPEYQTIFNEMQQTLVENYAAGQVEAAKLATMENEELIAVTMMNALNTAIVANYGKYETPSNFAEHIAERVNALAPSNASIIGPNVDNTKSRLTDEGYVALKLVYNKGRITFELVESVIDTLLGSLGFGIITQNLRINYVGLGLDLSAGVKLEVMLQIDEIYTFELGIKQLKVSIDEDERDNYAVVISEGFTEEGLVGIPEAVFVQASAGFTLHNIVNALAEEEGVPAAEYNLTKLLGRFLSGSNFKYDELNEIYTTIKDASGTDNETLLKKNAWDRLYSDFTGTNVSDDKLAKRNEMDEVHEKMWETIVKEQAKAVVQEKYLNVRQNSQEHYALSWDKLIGGAVRVELDELGVEVIAELFDNINATLFVDAQLWANITNIHSSSLKVTIRRWSGELNGDYTVEGTGGDREVVDRLTNNEKRAESDEVLTLFYDGSTNTSRDEFKGTVYVDTNIFDIGRVKLEDITGLFNEVYSIFTSSTIGADVVNSVRTLFGMEKLNEGASGAANVAAALNAADTPSNASSVFDPSVKTYLDLLFRKGELGIGVEKAAILNVLNFFMGVDLTEEMSKIDFGVDLMVEFNQNLGLQAAVYLENDEEEKTEVIIGLGEIDASLSNRITPMDDSQFITVEEFANVGVAIGGYAGVMIGNEEYEMFNFDYLFELLYGALFDSRDPGIGMRVGVMDGTGINAGDVFNQTNYLEIRANVNLLTLSDLTNIELYITLTSGANHDKYVGMKHWRDIMDAVLEREGIRLENGTIDYETAWRTLKNEVGGDPSSVAQSDLDEATRLQNKDDKDFFAYVMQEVELMASKYASLTNEELFEKHWNELYGRCGDYYMGDVLSLYITLKEGDESKGQSPIYGNIYLNLAILGVEPVVLSDVTAFLKAIEESFNLDYEGYLGWLFNTGKKDAEEEGASNAPSNASGSELTELAGKLLIAMNTKEKEVLMADITSAALYSVLVGLGIGDIRPYFGEAPEGTPE